MAIPLVDLHGVLRLKNRVESIVASHNDPVWVIAVKESGYVGIVEYSDPAGLKFPLGRTIATARAFHDGGFGHSGDHFLVAANTSNKMVVVGLVNQTLAATTDTGLKLHPGRGVNWFDPEYG